jgi:signal transduction histidine kinase
MSEIRILVVDDNEANRYYKAHILRRQGYSILEAARGAEVVSIVRAQEPALVLLDVKLPDIGGLEVCRRIKGESPRTMVLQTSAAFTKGQDRAIGLQGGADSYLIEPIEPDELVATVTALLRLRRAEQELRALNEDLERRVGERTRELVDANRRLAAEMDQRAKAEEALRHAQKLDALGRLTGGVAHDFNNLLTVVIGNLELIERELVASPAIETERVGGLVATAHRAAVDCERLTRQLLVFARREVLHPEVVDLSAVVGGFDNLLQRALGENVSLALELAPDLWLCSVDRSQFEAAILNLAVNARQAVSTGGQVKIVTRNFESDARIAARSASALLAIDLLPGQYVAVSISDNGRGMDERTLSRAFEPFFTTKDVGEGSGLGLSQVYGFVRQSGGHLTVDTAVGAGTTVCIYLPRSEATVPAPAAGEGASETLPRGEEAILIVEDNELVLSVAVDIITELGYRILTAPDAVSALDIIASGKPIDLLFSDVVMPNKINGIELAREARRLRPGLKVLLTTVYPLLDGDTRDGDGEFLSIMKPYRRPELARRLREALGAEV